MASLLAGDGAGRLGDELPLRIWDPLVFVGLGELVFLFVEHVLLNRFDIYARLADLLVVALLPPPT